MKNEVLIYGGIYNYSASEFINSVNNISSDSLVVRMDTNGGDPQSAYGIAAKFNEFEGDKVLKIDGRAYSSGFLIATLVDNVEALDVSEFMVHRAAYADWIESSEYFTDDLKSSLKRINDQLKAAFIKKIDVEAFEKMKDVSVDEIFSMESRIDVYLTAKEAKKIGLIKKINKLTPEIKAEINSKKFEVAANYRPKQANTETPKVKNKIMTKEEFKTNHPEAYASIVGEGVSQRNAEIEAEKVAIEAKKAEKEAIRAEVLAEIEAAKKDPAQALANESAPVVNAATENIVEPSELEKLSAKLNSELGIKS